MFLLFNYYYLKKLYTHDKILDRKKKSFPLLNGFCVNLVIYLYRLQFIYLHPCGNAMCQIHIRIVII